MQGKVAWMEGALCSVFVAYAMWSRVRVVLNEDYIEIRLLIAISSKGYCRNSVCSRTSPQPCLDPPKSEWHNGQRQINEAGKCIRENTALRTKFRGGVRVQACHAVG